MKFFGREVQGVAKLLLVLVYAFLVSSGLCGIQYVIADQQKSGIDNTIMILMITGMLELAVMSISALAIVVVLLYWAVFKAGVGLSALVAQMQREKAAEHDERADKADEAGNKAGKGQDQT
jgi:hypothetical protein